RSAYSPLTLACRSRRIIFWSITKWTPIEVQPGIGLKAAEDRGLLGGAQQRRRSRPELLEERGLVRLGGRKMPQLDMAEAADFFRNSGKPYRDVVIAGIELRQHFLKHC